MMGWQEQLQTILLVLGGLLLLIDPAAGQMEFLNPPPSKRASDFNSDLIYQMGEVVNVAWTPGREGKLTSLALWQLNATTTQYYGDFEYITRTLKLALLLDCLLTPCCAVKRKRRV